MRLLNMRCFQSYLIISSILSGGTPDTSYLERISAPVRETGQEMRVVRRT